jgi:hypothetical protein
VLTRQLVELAARGNEDVVAALGGLVLVAGIAYGTALTRVLPSGGLPTLPFSLAPAPPTAVAPRVGAGTIVNAGGIHINRGTLTDKQSISDLAHVVSEEIIHSMRLQGGLLPHM